MRTKKADMITNHVITKIFLSITFSSLNVEPNYEIYYAV